ncbi:OLC1v1008912C1 [Oldenlandia corymbosa var. corymbosa]|uniref:Defective in cullin neddylation protein n=1 Tax=Oldenlandia corymbosa var. corymbosa TaxID=529605 RepID=A0AAV1DMN1_OLDCO|nr:OLC1v1008912C1 [Oldenlandia corymbosa var. corymbosa]
METLDIFEIYRRYCEIVSGFRDSGSKAQLIREALTELVESRRKTRHSITEEIHTLMTRLGNCLRCGDSSEFSRFYDFVFFICRENGQKSISVSRAINAWRLVLAGKFRLLNQWCNFVGSKSHRHNISEDTWKQVLAFSQIIRGKDDDLELQGYDPQDAWPILIDDFVEHIHKRVRINPKPVVDQDSLSSDMVRLLRLSKRKSCDEDQPNEEEDFGSSCSAGYSDSIRSGARDLKKARLNSIDNCDENNVPKIVANDCLGMTEKNNQLCCTDQSACASEGCRLAKGFARLFCS